jgi:hypothetical protein
MKKLCLILALIFIGAGCFSNTALATTFVGANGFGIQKIRFFDMTENQVNISIRYVDCSGYSVKHVQDDEVLYHGELPKSFDEYLPSNRIRITLSDCKMTEKIKTQYSAWTVYDADCENEDICFMWCYNADHGIYLFVASDSVLHIDEQLYTKLNKPIGEISISINLQK